jgi:hypothetical protein
MIDLPPIEYTPPRGIQYYPKSDEKKYYIVDEDGLIRRVFTQPCDLVVEE